MLNPNASEFKPGQFGTPATPSQPPEPQEKTPLPPQQQQQHSKKRPPKAKHAQQLKHRSKSDRRSSTDQRPPPPPPSKKSTKPKNQQKQQQQQAPPQGHRHKASSSAQQQSSTLSSLAQQGDADGFGLLTKFITIEEAIDPVFRTRPGEDGSKSIDGSETAAGKLVHGYERYIEWMTRCLRAFETITVVGMDYAIADVVSLVTILHRRKIGEHEEVETFSLDQGNKRYTSGIQVKLHLCA